MLAPPRPPGTALPPCPTPGLPVGDVRDVLAAALAQSPVALLLTDAQYRIIWANERLYSLSGYTPAAVLGRTPRLFSAGRHPPGLIAEMRQQLGSGQPWLGEFVNRRPDGGEYRVRCLISPQRDAHGTVTHFLAFQEDITAVRQEQEHRRRLEARLFQALKAETVSTLAGGIAHDFNNLLTGILGFAEIAALSLADDHPARSDLEEVRVAGVRAKDLVAQVLLFSRQRDTQQRSVDLAAVVEEAVRLVRPTAPATIEIVSEFQSATVRADPAALQQVVLNLSANALHAMRGTPGRLTFGVHPVEVDAALAACVPRLKTGPSVRLAVSDTGHGMDAATLARLFEPFFTTKPAGEGTGLGLALVHGIVQAHRGALRVSSTVGEGARFEIYLPICAEREAGEETGAVAAAPGHDECVLVVDDEKSISSFVAVRLEQLHYRAEVFNDPRDALAAIRSQPGKYAVLLTDQKMPYLSGRELVLAARAIRPQLPVVVMSGYGAEGAASEACATTGPTVPLAKPFSGEALARAVARALGIAS